MEIAIIGSLALLAVRAFLNKHNRKPKDFDENPWNYDEPDVL